MNILRRFSFLLASFVMWRGLFGEDFHLTSMDVSTVGSINYTEGLGRIPVGLIALFKDTLAINHVKVPGTSYDMRHVPSEVSEHLKNVDTTPGNVALFTLPLYLKGRVFADYVPEQSYIKIAYSMIESSALPPLWADILNNQFDAVVVPDDYYYDVYCNSGVRIPIFVLPHGIYLEKFFAAADERKLNLKKDSDFIFGCIGSFIPRKNQDLLIDAFHEEFKNEPWVKLKLHGNWWFEDYRSKIKQKIADWKTYSIIVSENKLSENECIAFYKSLHCYVLLSKGEGFSVTPREALAMRIPCILSNATAHRTLCNNGFLYCIDSNLKEAADYGPLFRKAEGGFYFNSDIKKVRKALRDVYTNYQKYSKKAQKGREWAAQYEWKSLKNKFLNLLKPQKILLGEQNVITDDALITNNRALYEKYEKLIEYNGLNRSFKRNGEQPTDNISLKLSREQN